jgi:hypothetical protein
MSPNSKRIEEGRDRQRAIIDSVVDNEQKDTN